MVYLDQPLKQEDKLPVFYHEIAPLLSRGHSPEAACSLADLELLFRVTEDQEAFYYKNLAVSAVAKSAPDSTGTEQTFIGFWDANIGEVLAAIAPGKVIRNDDRSASTPMKRPGFGFLTHGVCAFRGEEGRLMFTGEHPKSKLLSKLKWTYDPAPYILGQ